jgi:hypothetical protein
MAINLQEQRQQLEKLKAELSNLKSSRSRLLGLSKGGLLKKPDPKDPKTIQIASQLATVVDSINAKQKEYDALEKAFNEAKTDTKSTSEVGSAEELRKAAEAGYPPSEIQQYRDDLAAQLKNKKDKKLAQDNAKQGETQSQELTNELASAGQFIARTLNDQGRVDLATQLNKVYNINLPLNGKYSPDLKAAYTRLLTDKFTRSLDEGRTLSTADFLSIATSEGTYRGSGGGKPDIFASISDPTQAAATITSVFKSELNRDPTADELTKYTKQLQSAERRNPFKTVDGIRTGGLDKAQFIVGELQKLPEFIQKKTDKAALTSKSILGTAKANGITLNQSQLDSFTKRVQDGEDIKTINSDIRKIAELGMPDKVVKLLNQGVDLDTIYSPYKSTMASTLEINPATIDLNDQTLRSAIGPDREMPIYEFEKSLRKDSRWQYTNNAREEAYAAVNKILQDFGFRS